jgi:predicted membrane protein
MVDDQFFHLFDKKKYLKLISIIQQLYVILYIYYDVTDISGKVGISMMEESLGQIKATLVKALCMAKF